MKPIKPINLSTEDHRRIMHWAKLGAMQEISEAEAELARHVSMCNLETNHSDDLVPNKIGFPQTRVERMVSLKEWIARYQATFVHLNTVIMQYNHADNERAGKEIAEAVLENRRAERREANAKKVVGDA